MPQNVYKEMQLKKTHNSNAQDKWLFIGLQLMWKSDVKKILFKNSREDVQWTNSGEACQLREKFRMWTL